jgi:glycine/sarcosine N-methyltransferase
MTQDIYKGFAERYDLFFTGEGQPDKEIENFYRKLMADNNVHSVLDCACGTGHDLIMFHGLGCEVVGTDISESMLAQARKNLSEMHIEVALENVDYRELPKHFTQKFDMVACLSTAIAEMPDRKESLNAFRSMHDTLREGGILVFTQGMTDRQMKIKPRFMPVINNEDFSRIFAIDYLDKLVRINILDISHSKEKRDFKHWSIEYRTLLLRDEQEYLLKKAGFSKVDFYGTYDFKPYDK